MLFIGHEGIRKGRLYEVTCGGLERGNWEVGFGGGEGSEQLAVNLPASLACLWRDLPRKYLLGIASEIKELLA